VYVCVCVWAGDNWAANGRGAWLINVAGPPIRMQLIERFSSQLASRDLTVRKLEITEIVSACALN